MDKRTSCVAATSNELSAQIYAQAGDKLVALNKFPKAPGRLHGLTGSAGLARSAA
jgi:hypothetical protein